MTKGPWIIEDGNFVYALNSNDINRMSLQVNGGYTDEGKKTPKAEIDNNALAISLLPELVEAARTVLTSAIWDGKSDQYADQLIKRDTLDRLRDVLNKIGG